MSFHERKLFVCRRGILGHSGKRNTPKIECDAIFPNEWEGIARMIMSMKNDHFVPP